MAKKKKGNNKKKKNNNNAAKQQQQPTPSADVTPSNSEDAAVVTETVMSSDSTIAAANNVEPDAPPEVAAAEAVDAKTTEEAVTPPSVEEEVKTEDASESPEKKETEQSVAAEPVLDVNDTETKGTEDKRTDAPVAAVEESHPEPEQPAAEIEKEDDDKAEESEVAPASSSTSPLKDVPDMDVVPDKDVAATVDAPPETKEEKPLSPEEAPKEEETLPQEKVEETPPQVEEGTEPAKEDPAPPAVIPNDDLEDSPSDEMGPVAVSTSPREDNSEEGAPAASTSEVSAEEKKVETSPDKQVPSETVKTPETSPTSQEKPKENAPSVSFAQAFGSPPPKPAPIQTTESATKPSQDSTPTPTPTGLTFAQAFSNKALPAVSPLATPASVSSAAPLTVEAQLSTKSTNSSHSALSASKNKKVSNRMSKYMEEVHHEPLPGDAVPIKKKIAEPSPSASYSSQGTPLSAQSIREKLAVTEVELAQLPNITDVSDKFESSARSSSSGAVFEFGESFRQKQRFEQLTDKEKEIEAKVAMHGFNENDLFPGRVASGEIDTSNLSKVYTFEMTANASLDLPPDGTCRVDYKKADYSAMVFVVHRTRGMLLLHMDDVAGMKKSHVPNGVIREEEFLDAATKSGSHNVQLQIAAREAAARQLYENTGLDIRSHVDRFKPAILRLNPPVDARGIQYLKNEYDNKLYYFLQVDEEDFAPIAGAETTGQSGFKLKRPSEDEGDSALTLRLRDKFEGFTFVLDPGDAAKILKEDGNKAATSALQMIMNEASEGISANGPDAKATEYSVGESAPDDEKADRLASGKVRTVGEKPPDTNEHVDGVTCCCGWW